MKATEILSNILSNKMAQSEIKLDLSNNDIHILFNNRGLDKDKKLLHWDKYLSILTRNHREEVLKYREIQDQNNCLIGKLLVFIGYFFFTGKKLSFSDLRRDALGKPYILNSHLYFNISHSGNGVMCGFSKNNLGLDIEELKELDVTPYKGVFTKEEFLWIKKQGVEMFYSCWTAKESVTKETGDGITIDLSRLRIEKFKVKSKDTTWWTQGRKMNQFYYTIASQKPINNSKILNLCFY